MPDKPDLLLLGQAPTPRLRHPTWNITVIVFTYFTQTTLRLFLLRSHCQPTEALLVPHSSAPVKMSQVNTPQLMELPREVRDSIWDYSTEGPIHYRVPKRTLFCGRCRYSHPAHTTGTTCTQSSTTYEDDYSLFFVSKQVRRESLKIFYKGPFALELSDISPDWSPRLLAGARQCLLRDTIPFKTLYTSVTIHIDVLNDLNVLYMYEFAGFLKLRHIIIDLGTLDLLCSCGGELCAQGKMITLPEVLHTMSEALAPFWTLTPKWAPTTLKPILREDWERRGIEINVKAKIRFIEEGHERRLVSHVFKVSRHSNDDANLSLL